MPSIQVCLLQRPRVVLNGAALHFSCKKIEALLYYLITEGQAGRREEGLALLRRLCREGSGGPLRQRARAVLSEFEGSR